MAATLSSSDEDWYIPNSDDESLESIELTKEQILQYILELDETGTLALEWKCPGRRPPTPKRSSNPGATTSSSAIKVESPSKAPLSSSSSAKMGSLSPSASSKHAKPSSLMNDYDFTDAADKNDAGASGVGHVTHKKFGTMSASGQKKQKLKSTDSPGGSSSSVVTVEKVMSDLKRQENEDKRNIDRDRIAKGLPTLSEEEQLKRKKDEREEAFRQVANSVVSVASLRQQSKDKNKKGGNSAQLPQQDQHLNDLLINVSMHNNTSGINTSAPSGFSIASLSQTAASNSEDRQISNMHSVSEADLSALMRSSNNDGSGGAVSSMHSNANFNLSIGNHFSNAQIQDSLQQQLMPNSFVTALDNLPAALFTTPINLQASSLLSDTSSAATVTTQGNIFGAPVNSIGNMNFSSSVAALTNQFQQSQAQFFSDSDATMLSNALSGVTSQDLLNLPPNFSADLLNSATNFDRVNNSSWN